MSQSENDLRIDYVELAVRDVAEAKRFYAAVFGWSFTDYGDHYTSFDDGRLSGGLTTAREPRPSSTLIVIYAADLEGVQRKVEEAGGFRAPKARRHVAWGLSPRSGRPPFFWSPEGATAGTGELTSCRSG